MEPFLLFSDARAFEAKAKVRRFRDQFQGELFIVGLRGRGRSLWTASLQCRLTGLITTSDVVCRRLL